MFLATADRHPRIAPAAGLAEGFSAAEAVAECGRCLHCDCRKRTHCALRGVASSLEVHGTHFKTHDRPLVEQQTRHADVIFEPGKCIKCGLCVEITRRRQEPLGLTFVGRGFDVKVAVPFGEPLSAGLKTTAAECVRACPTGALAFKAPEIDRD